MLLNLSIRDLAVVEMLDLAFEPGLTVLTGETGAGKSILLTALGLALGERADSGFIRPGAERAEINLAFDLADSPPSTAQWLEERGLAQEDNVCLVRRILGREGRSRAFINDRAVTLQGLQELGQGLMEIHGQHAHVLLLKSVEQRRLLDEAADNGPLLERVGELHQKWCILRDELAHRTSAIKDAAARGELLRYQIDEMEQHDIRNLDYDSLVEEHTLQANIGKVLNSVQSQLETLYEDEHRSVNAQLAQVVHALALLVQIVPELGEIVAILKEAQVQVKEGALQLRRQLEGLEADPKRLEWLEQRLADVHKLARKHQVRPEELPGHLEALQKELANLAHGAERLDTLRAELEQVARQYSELADGLSERRRNAAESMGERISAMIRELGMPQGQFRVEVRLAPDREPTPHGLDHVEFLVSANPGLPPRSLAKVASGGELSRISLAIQVAATDSKTVPTLIFDEVDTGIGGRVAEIVGRKLRLLGQSGPQVFCVTHLPQVAVHGHNHLLVEKTNVSGTTHSSVRKLAHDERIMEIARMLGGIQVTRQTLAHAEEMLSIHREGQH